MRGSDSFPLSFRLTTRLLLLCAACLLTACTAEQAERPNFLVILADDMGYSDIGVMGSEIRTPNIDRLAERGMLMTHFRVHMMCSPTRAMLLTGADSHPAGYGTMAGEFTPAIRGQQGVLEEAVRCRGGGRGRRLGPQRADRPASQLRHLQRPLDARAVVAGDPGGSLRIQLP